mgnify:CR=1 FL=1
MDKGIIELCAEIAHEANRAYCRSIGDNSQPHWSGAPEWQQQSCLKGILGVLNGATPEQSHEAWLEEKREYGWKYGPVKNPDTKEHPCFVPYSELPKNQQMKDHIFTSVVRAVLSAFKEME